MIIRLYLGFQVQRFGKWRPSAEARRLGTVRKVWLGCLVGGIVLLASPQAWAGQPQ